MSEGTVIVIGGGVIGIASAHYLTEAGYSVTVLESDRLASGCSHGNCGYLCPSHTLPLATPGALREGIASLLDATAPFRIKPRLEISFLRWLWQFARRCNERQMLESARHLSNILTSSAAEYAKLLEGPVQGVEWRRKGLLYAFETPHGVEEFADTENILRSLFGVHAQWMDGEALTAFDPALKPGLAGGYLFPEDASLRPDRLTSQWIALLKSRGVTFLEGVRFDGAERAGQVITALATSRGAMTADHYVLATGAMSGQLARHFGRSLPIEPGKGYSITMERPACAPETAMLFPEHHVGITPFDKAFRIGSMMEFVGFDRSIPQARVDQLRGAASRYLVSALPPANLEEWYGWRPMTWDSLPIIGAMPGTDNVMLATGHNMLGMTLAPATGRLVAELVAGQMPHIDPEPFSAARFG